MSDGWNEELLSEVIRVLEDAYQAEYEIKNCRRGAYSDAYTYKDLGEWLEGIADRLKDAAINCQDIYDPDEEEEEGEEGVDPDARIGGDY